MHKTFAHLSVAIGAEIGLPSLLTLIEAHEETWDASTTEPQTYVTTLEHQSGGLDRRWIAGREIVTEAGTFSAFAAGTRIEREDIPAGQSNRVEYLRLQGSLAVAIEQTLNIRPNQPLILPSTPPALALIFTETLKIIFQRPTHWPWRLTGALAELTRTLDEVRRHTSSPPTRLVDQARALVEETPHHPWSVKELAVLLEVRRERLWELFMEQTGQAPGDWIRQHRIRVAQAFLARGISVRETAARLEFSSRQQFARAYRAVTGQTPSAGTPNRHRNARSSR